MTSDLLCVLELRFINYRDIHVCWHVRTLFEIPDLCYWSSLDFLTWLASKEPI